MQENANLVSAYCSDAYKTLTGDVTRAQYLLKVKYNIDSLVEGEREKDAALMEWVFETRMEIEEADEMELSTLLLQINTEQDDLVQYIAGNFGKGDLEEVKKSLEKTKYLEQMINEIELKQANFRDK